MYRIYTFKFICAFGCQLQQLEPIAADNYNSTDAVLIFDHLLLLLSRLFSILHSAKSQFQIKHYDVCIVVLLPAYCIMVT